MLPPWMIEEMNKAEKAEKERRRQEEANRPRVYVPEYEPRAPEPKAPSNRGVCIIELGGA